MKINRIPYLKRRKFEHALAIILNIDMILTIAYLQPLFGLSISFNLGSLHFKKIILPAASYSVESECVFVLYHCLFLKAMIFFL